jgi:hypothetical protein
MKIFLIISSIFLSLLSTTIYSFVMMSYEFENKYSKSWDLAQKSSTIQAKMDYINIFLNDLEQGNKRGDFASHNAILLKTQNNSFKDNVGAIKTLANRLRDIKDMDPKSFEYNVAIQQITAQEQNEAGPIISTIMGCYALSSYIIAWGWIGIIFFVATVFSGIACLFSAILVILD